MTPEELTDRAFAAGLVQPDRRTCGAATLVAARMVNDPAFAAYLVDGAGERIAERFRAAALAMHRRTSSTLGAGPRMQLPWPRALGTSPWALVRQLDTVAGVPGTRYGARLVLPHQRPRAFDAVCAAVAAGYASPLYVGNRLSPRHVVLGTRTTPRGLVVYDPAQGRRYPITRADFVGARLDVAGWRVPWLVVLPRRP